MSVISIFEKGTGVALGDGLTEGLAIGLKVGLAIGLGAGLDTVPRVTVRESLFVAVNWSYAANRKVWVVFDCRLSIVVVTAEASKVAIRILLWYNL